MSVIIKYVSVLSSHNGTYTSVQIPYPGQAQKNIKFVVTLVIDKDGAEAAKYEMDGRPLQTLRLDKLGVFELGPSAVLHPQEETAALPALGLLLPPGLSRLHSPSKSTEWTSPKVGHIYPAGLACAPESDSCQTFNVPIGYSGNCVVAQWHPAADEMVFAVNGKASMNWTYTGKTHGFPTDVSYEERDGQATAVDSAHFHLVEYKEDASGASASDLAQIPSEYTVMKGNVGCGYTTQSNFGPWEFYAQQEAMTAKLAPKPSVRKAEFPWLPSSLLAAAVLVGVVSVKLRRK